MIRSWAAGVADEHGAWKTYGERLIYDNQWVKLGLADVEAPNGQRWEYHVVHLARIAIGLIIDERDRVLMLWRYRFPTDQWGYELLGGLVEGGEDPADTARREVLGAGALVPLLYYLASRGVGAAGGQDEVIEPA